MFCVLTQFHRHLRRRDIYAEASARWRDEQCLKPVDVDVREGRTFPVIE